MIILEKLVLKQVSFYDIEEIILGIFFNNMNLYLNDFSSIKYSKKEKENITEVLNTIGRYSDISFSGEDEYDMLDKIGERKEKIKNNSCESFLENYSFGEYKNSIYDVLLLKYYLNQESKKAIGGDLKSYKEKLYAKNKFFKKYL